MKDVISVDSVLNDSYIPIKIPDVNRAKLKKLLHSLLISKLPEKATESKTLGKDYQGYSRGYNSAIDDVKAVLDELFRSGDES